MDKCIYAIKIISIRQSVYVLISIPWACAWGLFMWFMCMWFMHLSIYLCMWFMYLSAASPWGRPPGNQRHLPSVCVPWGRERSKIRPQTRNPRESTEGLCKEMSAVFCLENSRMWLEELRQRAVCKKGLQIYANNQRLECPLDKKESSICKFVRRIY